MDERLVIALSDAALHMRRVGAALTKRAEAMDVSVQELKALSQLRRNAPDAKPSVFAQDLTGELHASKAAVSQMLNSLEKRGLIARSFNPENRRKIALTLTPEGARIILEAERRINDSVREVIREFGEDNARQLARLMEQLTEIIEKRTT